MGIDTVQSSGTLGHSELEFLARLPILLNSSLEIETVIESAVHELRSRVEAEAATVFLLNRAKSELTFWAAGGESDSALVGRKMPASQGIVGWVISNQTSALVNDTRSDARFFPVIDREGGFRTRNLLTAPLKVKGTEVIGALQVLNKKSHADFTPRDLEFVEQFGHHVALAISNAMLYRELQMRNRQLEMINRRKADMMAVVNHEFRTPLNLIQNTADLLVTGKLSEEQRERMARTLEAAVERLHRIVRQIGDASSVERETFELSRERIVVEDLFNDLERQHRQTIEKRGLQLEVQSSPASVVDADYVLIYVALKNLLANAIRFTPDGGTITLTSSAGSGLVDLSVKDTGIGIEASEIPLIFEKFYEVANAMNHTSGEYEFRSAGLGLGLPTVKGILDAHRVEIRVISTPGEGSTFTFSLPAAI